MLLRNATPFSLWFLHIKKEVEGLENIPVVWEHTPEWLWDPLRKWFKEGFVRWFKIT